MRSKADIEKEYSQTCMVYGSLKYKVWITEIKTKEGLAEDYSNLNVLEKKLLELNEEASKLETQTQPQDDNGV